MATEDACAKLPPASSNYSPEGSWDTVAHLNTYVTGPSNPTRAIVFIYDIFGLAPQTLQGADRLANSINGLVIVPDFFKGVYAQPNWTPPDTEEKKAAFAKFRSEQAGIPQNVGKLIEFRKEAGEKWSSVGEEGWGVFGLCWGGKLGILVSGAGNEGRGRKFAASGTAHPSRLDVQDAEALSVPYLCLASPGEPAEIVAQYKEVLSKPGKVGVVETYDSMFHGWMGARAKLDDEKNRAEYERGYNQTAEFFRQHLSSQRP
ncbi:dienelactone hydrolase family protein [Truncatella angustata]|uniref:Dienelactone hydrolase family protein n=1 Tax=Truncatella angustata TaxID=152316 RepID=A0A9P9A2Y5_9PEZI|nr:dienelactone hydrolase family protein [Truncatella angustata]KAH6658400.1 dienelactone hydrolase family protein [Truncatella angustata]